MLPVATRLDATPQPSAEAGWCRSHRAAALRSRLATEHAGVWAHSCGTARIALALGEALGPEAVARLPEPEVVRTAAELHDIGKLLLPRSLLDAPRALTPEERRLVGNHAGQGADLLERAGAPPSVVLGARLHHHRYDDQDGPALPALARLLALADSLEAMTSPLRSYRRPLTEAEALAEVARGAGGQFDPAMAACVIRLAPAWPLSIWPRARRAETPVGPGPASPPRAAAREGDQSAA